MQQDIARSYIVYIHAWYVLLLAHGLASWCVLLQVTHVCCCMCCCYMSCCCMCYMSCCCMCVAACVAAICRAAWCDVSWYVLLLAHGLASIYTPYTHPASISYTYMLLYLMHTCGIYVLYIHVSICYKYVHASVLYRYMGHLCRIDSWGVLIALHASYTYLHIRDMPHIHTYRIDSWGVLIALQGKSYITACLTPWCLTSHVWHVHHMTCKTRHDACSHVLHRISYTHTCLTSHMIHTHIAAYDTHTHSTPCLRSYDM